MPVVGVAGMLDDFAEWLSALLSRCQCACSLLQAASSPPPAASQSSTPEQQLKDVAKKINEAEKDFNNSAAPKMLENWQDESGHPREEKKQLAGKERPAA